jgi:hypothetical protein
MTRPAVLSVALGSVGSTPRWRSFEKGPGLAASLGRRSFYDASLGAGFWASHICHRKRLRDRLGLCGGNFVTSGLRGCHGALRIIGCQIAGERRIGHALWARS